MYVTCGEVELARLIFDQNHVKSVFLWNSMIRYYSWNGPFDEGIDMYYKMIDLGIRPNKFTFPFVLKACSGLKALEEGREIHGHVKEVGLDSDVYVCTALIDLYAKCGCLTEARELFDKMTKRDVVAWNAMIAGSSLHGVYVDTIELVLEMQGMGISPNSSTFVAVLPAVGQAIKLNQGRIIHGYCVRRGFDNDGLVATSLLDMYGKCECLRYSCIIFGNMGVRNEITWSAMIGAYVQCGHMGEALMVFDRMCAGDNVNMTPPTLGSVLRACAKLTDVSRGRRLHGYLIKSGFMLDIMIENSLLAMYSKCGILEDAIRLFDEMKLKDSVSYSAIISGCVQNGNAEEALVIYREMLVSRVVPDMATMVGILPACAHLAALEHGRSNHCYLTIRGYALDTSVGNALIDMYSKCGQVDSSRKIFDRMPRRDIITWNTMIAGYGLHGRGREALLLFNDLRNEGLGIDCVTFISLLFACSHSGLVCEGKHWFAEMTQEYNIVPRMEHYICMVDLLGRGGFLNEACNFIGKMPLKPDLRVWGALLGACRIHKNLKLGEEVSKKIQMLGPEGSGNFVLLSNMYSAAGRWNEAANVRVVQMEKGFKKSPGCSWIEICGSIHAFIGGDQSHPQSQLIYEKLEGYLVEMKKLGYQADVGFALQDVEQEEKERSLLYHSEKLAIVFGILNKSSNKPIFVTKNLRICGDCHSAIKFITTITNRAITVRDASRFHHFSDGTCNCGDFW
ncbi:hypothetical protein GIB67_006235 [Kingdonia uniflora]|uniref:DYW domain-containing protein n=1 Tax=Kingdonia uniflora TaxID=39325 RepID=A0A7J7P5I2_9MAGN|nr:hypothetical protein GIB67_006235 [Kingdonia uniflora]